MSEPMMTIIINGEVRELVIEYDPYEHWTITDGKRTVRGYSFGNVMDELVRGTHPAMSVTPEEHRREMLKKAGAQGVTLSGLTPEKFAKQFGESKALELLQKQQEAMLGVKRGLVENLIMGSSMDKWPDVEDL